MIYDAGWWHIINDKVIVRALDEPQRHHYGIDGIHVISEIDEKHFRPCITASMVRAKVNINSL
jgi:hypothetical protein